MHNSLKNIVIILALISLSGCAITMDVDRYSISPPGAELDKNQRIVVKNKSDDNWNSAHYVEYVVKQFNELGYDAVIDAKGKDGKYPYGRYMAVYSFENETESYSYEYSSNTYGVKDSGSSTINCNSYDSSVSCTERKSKTFGVTGKETKTATGSVTFRSFYLWIYDLRQKDAEGNLEQVLYTATLTDDDFCNEKYMYEQLVKVAISTMKTGPQSEGQVRIDKSGCPRD